MINSKINRIKNTTKKRYKGWCDYCDQAIVEAGKKCSKCNRKNKP
jgi:hypothetical protein